MNQPLISLSEIKTIYKKNPESDVVRRVKDQLDHIVNNSADCEMELEEIFDHDYTQPEIAHCMMYYMAATIVKRVMNNAGCSACKNALLRSEERPALAEAHFSDVLMGGPLIHSSKQIYRFVLFLEERFIFHSNSPHLFDDILDDVYKYSNLTFSCKEHATDRLYQIIHLFISTRMREFCARFNAEQKKLNQEKRKMAKLLKT